MKSMNLEGSGFLSTMRYTEWCNWMYSESVLIEGFILCISALSLGTQVFIDLLNIKKRVHHAKSITTNNAKKENNSSFIWCYVYLQIISGFIDLTNVTLMNLYLQSKQFLTKNHLQSWFECRRPAAGAPILRDLLSLIQTSICISIVDIYIFSILELSNISKMKLTSANLEA